MARSALRDYLQVYRFWLTDITPISSISLPLFQPLMGFSAITAPEITADTEEIVEGNWHFKRKVVKQSTVSQIVLRRGATFQDSDFYNWIMASITGDTVWRPGLSGAIGGASPRRNLLLIQYFARNPYATVAQAGTALLGQKLNQVTSLSDESFGVVDQAQAQFSRVKSSAINHPVGKLFSQQIATIGPFEFVANIPARVFILSGCIPVRYRPSQDFDAQSSEISIMELTLEVEMMEQVNLA